MKHKEEFITEEKVINTPAGGVLIGKDKEGQTIIPNDGSLGGFLVGRLHKDGGIKAINKGTGQPLEMQSNEIVITAPAVADTTKREFEGKMMTNREILSKINSDGGGVSFADGGDIPAKIHTTDCEYKFSGKVVKDTDIAQSLGMNSTLKKGKQHFTSGDTTYDVDAIYNAIKKGKLRLKTKEVETFPMKYPVYDKKYSETLKTDFRKPNGITVRTENGEEVLIDGNHRMNNAYLKGKKTMKTYYIEDPKQIAKFTKKREFELGGGTSNSLIKIKEYEYKITPFDKNPRILKGVLIPASLLKLPKIDERNYFLNTIATFKDVTNSFENKFKADFISDSGSEYMYKDNGVYRKSDHWGWGIASCDWELDSGNYGMEHLYANNKELYLKVKKEKGEKIGFCKWDDFKLKSSNQYPYFEKILMSEPIPISIFKFDYFPIIPTKYIDEKLLDCMRSIRNFSENEFLNLDQEHKDFVNRNKKEKEWNEKPYSVKEYKINAPDLPLSQIPRDNLFLGLEYYPKNMDNKYVVTSINREENKIEISSYSVKNYEFEEGGHLSKGKSLKQIAEMHNVSLAHVNEQLAKGLEVEKEHFADFKERTKVAKDHLVENPNYYTVLEKAGLEKGGKFDSKPFLDYYFEEIKDFLKYQNDIKLKDDFTFFYKGENFKIEPLILADKEKEELLQEALFTIIDQDDEEVGEIKFDANSKQNKKFEAYSDFFEWNNIKFENGGHFDYGGAITEEDLAFDKITEEIKKELEKRNLLAHLHYVSKSNTDFGQSWYLKFRNPNIEYNPDEDLQVRISDHSVTSINRILDQKYFAFISIFDYFDENNAKKIVDDYLYRLKGIEEKKEKRITAENNYEERKQYILEKSKSFLQKIKEEGKAIFFHGHTQLNENEIIKRNPTAEFIFQISSFNGGYEYYWINKNNGYGKFYLEPIYFNFLVKKGVIEANVVVEKIIYKKGGTIPKENLVKDAEDGNTPARDLNNYNDLLDVQVDGMVGGDSGIFADGGETNKEIKVIFPRGIDAFNKQARENIKQVLDYKAKHQNQFDKFIKDKTLKVFVLIDYDGENPKYYLFDTVEKAYNACVNRDLETIQIVMIYINSKPDLIVSIYDYYSGSIFGYYDNNKLYDEKGYLKQQVKDLVIAEIKESFNKQFEENNISQESFLNENNSENNKKEEMKKSKIEENNDLEIEPETTQKDTFEKEGHQEGKGKLYEFFTPQLVADKMVALAQHYGFKGGNVLDPAGGNGRLVKFLKNNNLTIFEINKENFNDLKKEFPNAEIYDFNFEKAFLQEPRFNTLLSKKADKTWLTNAPFDLVIANPPYGKFSGLYSSYFKFKGQVEHFFIIQSLKLLKSGGLGVYLIPSSFMRNGISYNELKKEIFDMAEFVDAYRLPSNIFKNTQIGTDIIILRKK